MIARFICRPPFIVAVLSFLLFALVACGGDTLSTSTPPTPLPTRPAPTATPTPVPPLTMYAGKGYSIGYPRGWTMAPGKEQVDFADATGLFHLTIMAHSNPGGAVNSSLFVNTVIDGLKKQMKNPQAEPLPPTTTVGSTKWDQRSINGIMPSSGFSGVFQIVILSTNYPANATNTQNFDILYGTTKDGFSTANTSYFQSMLKSFKFL